MKNDKSIENKLRSAVSHAVPDALDDILSACDHEKGKVTVSYTHLRAHET